MTQDLQTLGSTKAGRRFIGFMRIFNSGDMDKLRQLVTDTITEESLEKHSAEVWTAQLQYIFAISGGLKVRQVLVTDDYYVCVLMQARNDERFHVIEMYVDEEFPHKVASFIQRMAQS